MKCKECGSCRKGWFPSKPNDYVCIGVPEPFIIRDINVECTEYDNKRNEYEWEPGTDCLTLSYDCCSFDVPTFCVTRKEGNKVRVLNTIQGDVAFGLYHYLTGGAILKEKEVETNADKIRSMNDEELAEFILSCTNNDIEFCHTGLCFNGETCTECALKWLQQSIKEE